MTPRHPRLQIRKTPAGFVLEWRDPANRIPAGGRFASEAEARKHAMKRYRVRPLSAPRILDRDR